MDAKEDAAEDEASVTRLRTKDDSSGGAFCGDEEEEEKERRRRVVGSSSSKQKGDVNDAINVESRFGEGVSSLSSKGNGALTTAKRKGEDEEEYGDEEERREIMPYRPTYGVGKEEGELLGKKEDLEEEDQEEEKFASMEEKFTNEEWWESAEMRDENANAAPAGILEILRAVDMAPRKTRRAPQHWGHHNLAPAHQGNRAKKKELL